MKPGVYPGLPMAEYLALPAVSSSTVRAIVDRCPRAAWFDSWLNPARTRATSDELDAGTIAHAILLEGSRDCVECIDPADYPTQPRKKGDEPSIPKGWTNDAIRAARDAARAAGKIPVLKSAMREIESMVDSARAYIDALRHSEPAIWRAFQPGAGDSELTIVWDDAGTLCRIRPDRISADRHVMVDVKTTATSAEPDTWGRGQLLRMGYAVSAAFYRRGISATYGIQDSHYVYLVIENTPPYLASLVGLDPAWLAYGEARVALGLERWRQCAARNDWPAYPSRVAYPELPAWAHAQMQEDGCDPQGIPYDVSRLFQKSEIRP